MKSLLVSAVLFLAMIPAAMAGSPPSPSPQTKESVAASCSALGPKGERLVSGCVNTETGAAVTCSNGTCTDYAPDPRYKSIKALLDANRVKQQKRAI